MKLSREFLVERVESVSVMEQVPGHGNDKNPRKTLSTQRPHVLTMIMDSPLHNSRAGVLSSTVIFASLPVCL